MPTGLGGGDVHGHIVGEFLKIDVLGHEVGLAVDLHHHADLSAHVNVGVNDPFAHGPSGPLGGRGQALFAKKVGGLFDVPVTLGQGLLAVHHAGSGFFPELFDKRCADLCHLFFS